MKALVISGGGSKGAFAGGIAEYLIKKEKIDYDIFVGTSTGSLLVPHLAGGNIDQIQKAYTSVKSKDVFNINPFVVYRDKKGKLHSRINHFNVLKQFIRKKKTFGETKQLRKTIRQILNETDFDEINTSKKKIIVTVSNMTLHQMEHKYMSDCSYEDFCDWIWISSCFVPFMSLVEKNGYEYADGGFGSYVPIQEAISAGATELDVVVLQPKHKTFHKTSTSNAFELMLNSVEFMLNQIAYDDIRIGHLQSIYNKDISIRFFFTPRILTEYSFHFDPIQMKSWWLEGFNYAEERLYGSI